MSIYKNKIAPTGKAWCSKCKKYLPIEVFYKNSATTLGVVHQCINCIKEVYQSEVKAKRKDYFSTPQGKATRMWGDIVARAENKDGKHPSYVKVKNLMTKQEFMAWVVPQLEKWSLDNDLSLASIDRVENTGHYELSNLQIIDRWENTRKTGRLRNDYAPEGTAWCSGYCQNYKPKTEFHKGSNKLTGLCNYCKTCFKKKRQERVKSQK